jgi:predicted RNase H-like HicB family nuclease
MKANFVIEGETMEELATNLREVAEAWLAVKHEQKTRAAKPAGT